MTLTQLSDATAALRGQLAAGIPIANATARMAKLQRSHADFWAAVAASTRAGRPMSDALTTLWPAPLVAAIRAGEATGTLVEVLDRVESSIALQQRLRASASRLMYPAGTAGAAILIAGVFMVTLIPTIADQLASVTRDNADPSAVAALSLQLRSFLQEHTLPVAATAIALIASGIAWVRTPEARNTLINTILRTPVAGDAFRQMMFGIWADYMSMAYAAGMSTIDALRQTLSVLPPALRPGVVALTHDLAVRHIAVDRAADAEQQPPNDPRREWPFYVTHAFIVGAQTGRLDIELARVAPTLVASGERLMDRALTVAYVVALAVAAAFTGAPIMLVYSQIFAAFGAVQ